jgi:hypothetical protein
MRERSSPPSICGGFRILGSAAAGFNLPDPSPLNVRSAPEFALARRSDSYAELKQTDAATTRSRSTRPRSAVRPIHGSWTAATMRKR